MSSERGMRQTVLRILRPLHAVPIENGAGVGTPDVNCSTCWLELKSLPRWPARPETPVRVKCFTPEQRLWLSLRAQAGGRTYLLLKVGRDWLLMRGSDAAYTLGFRDKEMLIASSVRYWPGGIVDRELLRELS